MFARTSRLLLRPGWAEDAPALVKAMSQEMICRDLLSAPWPLTLCDAQARLNQRRDPILPAMLIFERTAAEPRLVGECGLRRNASGAAELYVWIVPDQRRNGFATEACRALLDIASALGLPQVDCGHHVDSEAAAALLARLGFQATAPLALRRNRARPIEQPIQLVRARLCGPTAECRPLAA